MKIPCNMLIIQPIIENIRKLLFRKIRRFFFAMFPYRPVYATHEWLFVILDSLDSRVLDIIRRDYIELAIIAKVPVRVIPSKLQSTDEVVGYLESWEKGRLICRRELRIEIKSDISIQFSSRSQYFQCRQAPSIYLGNNLL